jgi:hypothetical protein
MARYGEISKVAVPHGAPIAGQVAIPTPADAVALSATSVLLPSGCVIVKSLSGNAVAVVGGSDVAEDVDGSGNGYVLEAGESVVIFAEDLADVYVIGTADDVFSYAAG